MWYFAWILGLGFAVLLAIMNALWLENEQARVKAFSPKKDENTEKDPHDATVTHGDPTEDLHTSGNPNDNEK